MLNVPEWIPGLSWIKREAEESNALGTQTKETLYQRVRERVVSIILLFTENDGDNSSVTACQGIDRSQYNGDRSHTPYGKNG